MLGTQSALLGTGHRTMRRAVGSWLTPPLFRRPVANGANRPTVSRVIDKGEEGGRGGGQRYRITDAGRAVVVIACELAFDMVVLNPPPC